MKAATCSTGLRAKGIELGLNEIGSEMQYSIIYYYSATGGSVELGVWKYLQIRDITKVGKDWATMEDVDRSNHVNNMLHF